MRLQRLSVSGFRNLADCTLDVDAPLVAFVGPNGQGKTNILEAIYLLATLRSFRGVGGAQMVRQGARGYFVGGRLVAQVDHDLKMYW
ncbi:MAG TPA: AAA family ATPase, partial [Myxococcota bacterium]|nr:AAA family ATPase [Myxococcota bacterium]